MEDIQKTRAQEVFMELFSGLPRLGPGLESVTKKALSVIPQFEDEVIALDVGCGTGSQTMVLAENLNGRILAMDNQPSYLNELILTAQEKGLAEKISVFEGNMKKMPFEKQTFDLIWAEGSIYIAGVETALRDWRKLLVKDGYFAFTELVFIKDGVPDVVKDFWNKEGVEVQSIDKVTELIKKNKLELLDSFILPEEAWWEEYYKPLEAKLADLNEKYGMTADTIALQILQATTSEINLYRHFSRFYGYAFFICKK